MSYGTEMANKNFDELVRFQQQIQKGLLREQRTDLKIEVISIINVLTSGRRETVQKEAVFIESKNRGFNHEEVANLIEELIKDKIIFEPALGYIKKTS
jgi:hypothetical protein